MPSSLENLLGIGKTRSAMNRSFKKNQEAALKADKERMRAMRMGDSPNIFHKNQEAALKAAEAKMRAMGMGMTKRGGRSRKSKSRKRGRTHKRK